MCTTVARLKAHLKCAVPAANPRDQTPCVHSACQGHKGPSKGVGSYQMGGAKSGLLSRPSTSWNGKKPIQRTPPLSMASYHGGGGGTVDKDSLYTGLVSHGDRTRAKGDTTRRGSVLCDLPPVLVCASGVVELHSTTTGRQLEHPGGHPPYAIRRGKEHPGPLVFPWVLQSPRAWATSLPPPANKGVPARCSRPFMTRHSHAWFDGMQQGVSQSLCELLASRSNMNMISLNRYSFIRGEVQFLRGRKIMFLLAKEAATGGRVGGDCPSAIALGG